MSDSQESWTAEFYQRVGNLPVMVCVIVDDRGYHYVGFSVSSPHNFDEEVAGLIARNRARETLLRKAQARAS